MSQNQNRESSRGVPWIQPEDVSVVRAKPSINSRILKGLTAEERFLHTLRGSLPKFHLG